MMFQKLFEIDSREYLGVVEKTNVLPESDNPFNPGGYFELKIFNYRTGALIMISPITQKEAALIHEMFFGF